MGFMDKLFGGKKNEGKPAAPREMGKREAMVPPAPMESNLPDPTGSYESVERDYQAQKAAEAEREEKLAEFRKKISSSDEHGAASM